MSHHSSKQSRYICEHLLLMFLTSVSLYAMNSYSLCVCCTVMFLLMTAIRDLCWRCSMQLVNGPISANQNDHLLFENSTIYYLQLLHLTEGRQAAVRVLFYCYDD